MFETTSKREEANHALILELRFAFDKVSKKQKKWGGIAEKAWPLSKVRDLRPEIGS
jgi:hypothetical protein